MNNPFRLNLTLKRKLKQRWMLFLFCCIFVVVPCRVLYNKFIYSKEYEVLLPIETNFSLVWPVVQPKLPTQEEKQFFLVVMVNSWATGQKHRLLRKIIRITWGLSEVNVQQHQKWKLFFSLGLSENLGDHKQNLQEASYYNDVIIGDFLDTYNNLIIKTFMTLYWTSTGITCQYLLKTDDDVFVRVPKVVHWLQKEGFPKPLYGGVISPHQNVSRNPSGKWRLTKEQYSEDIFPPFCYGAFYVISTDTIPKIINYRTIRKPFHTDDAYVAVALSHYGVNAIRIPGFDFKHPFEDRTRVELICATAMAHQLDFSTMLKYQAFYQKCYHF